MITVIAPLFNICHQRNDIMKNTVIQKGIIVAEDRIFEGDVLIVGEEIADIRQSIEVIDAEIIDAGGCYVLPGGIDVHTHFNLDVGFAVAQDDFYSGTVAAAFGGTTTIIDHPGFGPDHCSIFHQIEKYHEYAKNKAVVDYSFHGVLQHLDAAAIRDIPKLIDSGIPTMKAYMTYGHMFTDEMLEQVIKIIGNFSGLLTVHAEDDAAINLLREKFLREGKTDARYHALSRPPSSEGDAIKRVIDAAEKAGGYPVYIVHLSTKYGLDHIKKAQSTGKKIIAETCPQYLLLDQSSYALPNHEGLKYVMSPPLRTFEHSESLWQGLADGSIKVVATDHCPFDFSLKKRLAHSDFTKCPGGIPGVETRIPLFFSESVSKNRLTLRQFSRVVSENPARIMGLYPRKGVIKIGSDADIVIIDPKKRELITHEMLHEQVDYTPYEDIEVQGWPIMTMVRGRIIIREGKFEGEAGYGTFIRRKLNN